MDITYYENLWRQKTQRSQESEAYWDRRAAFFNSLNNSETKQETHNILVHDIIESGILSSSSSVLDIGCGVGRNTIPLAKIAKKVIGTDISSQALSFAKENAGRANLSNIEFVKSDWADINIAERNWDHKFELVFASMCPGIDGIPALEKMTAASSSNCMVSLFAAREEKIRNELAALVNIPSANWHHTGRTVYSIFNILWLMDFFPEIEISARTWEHNFSLEDSITHYSSILGGTDNLTADQINLIQDYLCKHAENNRIKETIQAKIAWISWKTK